MTLQPQQHPDALSDMVHAYVERIRELEAEVLNRHPRVDFPERDCNCGYDLHGRNHFLEARAEKAEAALSAAYVAGAFETQGRKIAEARVAELEGWLGSIPAIARAKGWEIEAREKEGD